MDAHCPVSDSACSAPILIINELRMWHDFRLLKVQSKIKKWNMEKNGLPFPLSFVIITVRRIFRAGGFAARLCRFIPKGLKNPPALNIRICNAFRITNPDILGGRIANPSEHKSRPSAKSVRAQNPSKRKIRPSARAQ